MIKKYAFFLLSAAVTATGLFSACTQQRQPCIQPTIVTLRFGTYHFDSVTLYHPLTNVVDSIVQRVVDTILPSPYIGPLRPGTGPQLFLYDSISGQGNKFSIILSNFNDTDTCLYLINAATVAGLNNSNADTIRHFDILTFIYTKKLSFLSNACGYTYFYNLLSVKTTHYNIDSVFIESSNVTSDVNVEHVEVIFKGVDRDTTFL